MLANMDEAGGKKHPWFPLTFRFRPGKLLLDSVEYFWIVPTVIVIGSVLLALGLIALDARVDQKLLEHWPILDFSSSDSALALLSVVAGSMITAGATVFSITIVALTLASMQFSPRILGNFMHDRATQVVLGGFLGVFAYCLILLRCIKVGTTVYIPALSMFMAILLALGGIALLIFFIYRISVSIQASHIAFRIVEDTFKVVDEQFPIIRGKVTQAGDPPGMKEELSKMQWQAVTAAGFGYVQNVDEDVLFHFACKHACTIRIHRYSGSFAVEGDPIAFITGKEVLLPKQIQTIRQTFKIGPTRTYEQDIAYGIWQLVDIALKALSPAVNDTSTGVMCINYLTAILARIAPRRSSSRNRFENGVLRLVTSMPNFESLLDQAFDQIRHNASDSIAIIIRMLHSLHLLLGLVEDPQRQRGILKHVHLIVELADRTLQKMDERALTETYISQKFSSWDTAWMNFQFQSTRK